MHGGYDEKYLEDRRAINFTTLVECLLDILTMQFHMNESRKKDYINVCVFAHFTPPFVSQGCLSQGFHNLDSSEHRYASHL